MKPTLIKDVGEGELLYSCVGFPEMNIFQKPMIFEKYFMTYWHSIVSLVFYLYLSAFL